MRKLLDFLDTLEQAHIFYKLSKVRDAIMVELAVPGERWEVEFLRDGAVEIEKFISEGRIHGEEEIAVLLEKFSDREFLK